MSAAGRPDRDGHGRAAATSPSARAPRGQLALTLYTRAGCHLCEVALATLQRVQRQVRFELAVTDIESSDALHRAYFERVPVVQLGPEVLYEYVIDEPELLARLSALRDGGSAIL